MTIVWGSKKVGYIDYSEYGMQYNFRKKRLSATATIPYTDNEKSEKTHAKKSTIGCKEKRREIRIQEIRECRHCDSGEMG